MQQSSVPWDHSRLTYILIPEVRMRVDERGEQTRAFGGVQINDIHTSLAQPVNSATERARLADYDLADPKLHDEPAAVPAWSQRRHHDLVLVPALTARLAEGVGFAMY
jgi:hypothetical protein